MNLPASTKYSSLSLADAPPIAVAPEPPFPDIDFATSSSYVPTPLFFLRKSTTAVTSSSDTNAPCTLTGFGYPVG